MTSLFEIAPPNSAVGTMRDDYAHASNTCTMSPCRVCHSMKFVLAVARAAMDVLDPNATTSLKDRIDLLDVAVTAATAPAADIPVGTPSL